MLKACWKRELPSLFGFPFLDGEEKIIEARMKEITSRRV